MKNYTVFFNSNTISKNPDLFLLENREVIRLVGIKFTKLVTKCNFYFIAIIKYFQWVYS